MINQPNPKALFYWARVTVSAAASINLTTNQSITSGNFSTLFGLTPGSAVFNSSCSTLSATFTQNGAATVTTFNAPAAGTYYVSIKYATTTVRNLAVPSPTTVSYRFSTSDVPGSTATVDLVKQ